MSDTRGKRIPKELKFIEAVRRELMSRFSDRLSMEDIAATAHCIESLWANVPRETSPLTRAERVMLAKACRLMRGDVDRLRELLKRVEGDIRTHWELSE